MRNVFRLWMLLCACAVGAQDAALVNTNGALVFPTNFLSANGIAPLASPALSGNPTAPTETAGDNDTSISTTAFVTAAIEALKALQLWQDTNAVLTTLAALTGGNSSNFWRGDGTFAQVSSNDVPGLPALIAAQLKDAPLNTTTYARSNGVWTTNLPASQLAGLVSTSNLPGLLSGLSVGNGGGLSPVGEAVTPPLGITPPFTVYRVGGAYSTSLRMSDYATAARGTTRYLLTNGNDSASGLTWADAKLTLSNALSGLTSSVAVYCGPGVYVSTGETNRTYFTNAISLVCTGGVAQFGQLNLIGSYSGYFKGIRFQGGVTDVFNWQNTNAQSVLAVDGCSFDGNQNDGFSAYADAGIAYLRDCGSFSNKMDGFNYYATAGGTNSALWVLEEGCSASWNGWTTNSANNGSTIHGGVSILRIGCTAYKNEGRNFHDIGSGKSWNIKCAGGGSRVAGAGKDVAFACASGSDSTTMILEGCEALFGSPLSYLYGTNGTLLVLPFQRVNDAAVVVTTDITTQGTFRGAGVTSSGSIVSQGTTDQTGASTGALRTSGGASVSRSLYVGTYATEQALHLRGTNQTVAPSGFGVMGAMLWTDGTNLCVVLQDSGGVRTTNKLSMTAWP